MASSSAGHLTPRSPSSLDYARQWYVFAPYGRQGTVMGQRGSPWECDALHLSMRKNRDRSATRATFWPSDEGRYGIHHSWARHWGCQILHSLIDIVVGTWWGFVLELDLNGTCILPWDPGTLFVIVMSRSLAIVRCERGKFVKSCLVLGMSGFLVTGNWWQIYLKTLFTKLVIY